MSTKHTWGVPSGSTQLWPGVGGHPNTAPGHSIWALLPLASEFAPQACQPDLATRFGVPKLGRMALVPSMHESTKLGRMADAGPQSDTHTHTYTRVSAFPSSLLFSFPYVLLLSPSFAFFPFRAAVFCALACGVSRASRGDTGVAGPRCPRGLQPARADCGGDGRQAKHAVDHEAAVSAPMVPWMAPTPPHACMHVPHPHPHTNTRHPLNPTNTHT